MLLAHNVYFTLKDNSPAAKEKLAAACKKYLSQHAGTLFFAAGTLCAELKREVNDREFDVALHVIFDSKSAHDQYQEAATHKQFIAENKENWKKVRVFDSVVER
jgi:heme-degrading monooxygenase HmoA